MNHGEAIQEILSLLEKNKNFNQPQPEVPDTLFKAGVLPFVKAGDKTEYLFMKPTPKHGDDPGIQIAKGSRLYLLNSMWHDSKEDQTIATKPNAKPEPIIVNALREAIEELGLSLDNIKSIMQGFITTYRVKGYGEERQMFLLPVEIKSKSGFPASLEGTDKLIWLDASRFGELRPDFAIIATEVDKIIM